jgi:ParB family chromosome partitioning protein
VKQRLRLAAVSPKLLDVYADDGMSLEQLMAFSVSADHTRQEQVWENVSKSGYDEPYQIRRMLTENAIRASDKRARFVGLDSYEAAGGAVLRDLFEKDDGGWLQDVPLLERLGRKPRRSRPKAGSGSRSPAASPMVTIRGCGSLKRRRRTKRRKNRR